MQVRSLVYACLVAAISLICFGNTYKDVRMGIVEDGKWRNFVAFGPQNAGNVSKDWNKLLKREERIGLERIVRILPECF